MGPFYAPGRQGDAYCPQCRAKSGVKSDRLHICPLGSGSGCPLSRPITICDMLVPPNLHWQANGDRRPVSQSLRTLWAESMDWPSSCCHRELGLLSRHVRLRLPMPSDRLYGSPAQHRPGDIEKTRIVQRGPVGTSLIESYSRPLALRPGV